MLAGIGGAEATTLEDETIEDATMALSILRQVSREFQTTGWHFNTDYDYPLSVNVDNKIQYPVTAVHVDAVDIEDRDLVKRGDFLYDWENRTFTFSDSNTIKCKIGSSTSRTCPRTARVYIMMRAARRFAKNVMGDEATVQYSIQDEQEARTSFMQDEARRAHHNMLTDSYSTNKVVARDRRPWPV